MVWHMADANPLSKYIEIQALNILVLYLSKVWIEMWYKLTVYIKCVWSICFSQDAIITVTS